LAVGGGIISCQIDAEAANYNYLTFTGEGGGIGYGYVEGVHVQDLKKISLMACWYDH
jgi:hypothetical protein